MIWKTIPTYAGFYEVSDTGEVRSVDREVWFTSKTGGRHLRTKKGKPVYQQEINSGYMVVWLNKNNATRIRTVHSLIVEAFIGPRPKDFDVCHNDGNKKNNVLTNLRYDSRRSNHKDKIRHGTNACGSKIAQAKLQEDQIISIRELKGAVTSSEAGVIFGVGRRTIERVWRNESWKHVLSS
jgi:hypothetical protein